METPLRKPFGDATCSSAGKGQDLPGLPPRELAFMASG